MSAPRLSHPPSDPPLPATIGRYEVVRLLGEGAMGRVLLAHDPVLDRDVAVKHLRGDLQIPRDTRTGLLTRMRHEARAAARVAHPNLVVLHDMGEDPEVGLFLVFEYVEGPTLKQRLVADGRLAPAAAARLVRELGAALTTAHEAGILHRDIKPENVMLSKTGGKIADFGIARIPDSTLTHSGGLMGTPAYSAPETFRASEFSPASDQFSLAATLYEAISGQRAFPGDDAVSVAARIANDAPPRFAASLGLASSVDDVLARALSRASDDRFPSCEAFGNALSQSLLAAAEPEAPRAPVEAPLPERRTGQIVLGAIVVVATAALLLRTALRSADPRSETAPAPALSDAPSATVSAPTIRPRPSASAPRQARAARVEPAPSSTAPSEIRPAPSIDAGASAAPHASASAGSASAQSANPPSASPPSASPSSTSAGAVSPGAASP